MYSTFITCSFDVYDTLLTRWWASQEGLYCQVATRLAENGLISVAPAVWAEDRIAVEQELWKKCYRTRALRLSDIYESLSQRHEWHRDHMQAAMQVEMDEELRSLCPIASNLAVLGQERQSGKRIAFVSDMHLNGDFISSALSRAGIMQPGDRLLVSSDVNKTKAGRSLFRHLIELSGNEPSRHIHYGDNLGSDVHAARETGIHGQHLAAGHLSKYEQAVAGDRRLEGRFRSLLAGTMRLVRVKQCFPTTHEQTIWNVGANVVGPVLYAYARWVIARAKQLGIRRLYFLARDGQLPLDLARIIQSGSDTPEVRYLYASRQARHLPSLAEDLTKTDLDWVLDTGTNRSVRLGDVARRLGLEASAMQAVLDQLSLRRVGVEEPLGAEQLSSLRDEILRNSALRRLIADAATRARSELCRYLDQEALLDAVPSAIVDTGWNGRLQRSLGKVLRMRAQGSPVVRKTFGFYFGLKSRLMAEDLDIAEAFFVDCFPGRHDDLCHAPIIELFTEATHGTTLGYKEGANGQCTPHLKEDINSKAIEWGLNSQRRAALEFGMAWESLSKEYGLDGSADEWKLVAEHLLDRFVFNPDSDEASVFGSFPKTSSQNHDDPAELALPVSRMTALRYLFIGGRGVARYKARPLAWVSGSCMRSGYGLLSKGYYFKKRAQWWMRR